MKIELEPDDIDLRINIDGGVLTLIDVDSGTTIEIALSESDMDYLKERLKLWAVGDLK